MKPLLLLLLVTSLYCADDLAEARQTIPEKVRIVFVLTVDNKDKGTKETTKLEQDFKLADWEKTYRPLTLQELRTFRQFGEIRTQPVTITIQTF